MTLPPRVISFAGRSWEVRRALEPAGPGPNRFDDSSRSVDVDGAGNLVLRVRPSANGWVCAEVVGQDTTGYGRYEWSVQTDLTRLDRNVVCGMFTWDESPDQHNREIDVEVSAWNGADGVVGQFVVQPADHAGHLVSFLVVHRADAWTCSFEWRQGAVTFAATGAPGWTFADSAAPSPRQVRPHINLWLARAAAPHRRRSVTVRVSDFRFTPATSTTRDAVAVDGRASPMGGPAPGD